MTWLDRPGAFESQIDRGGLHFRSSRLNAAVSAMQAAEREQSNERLHNAATALFQWRGGDPNEFSNRFGEPRYREVMSELLAECRTHHFGIPLVVDPKSHPTYEPRVWNDNRKVLYSTNCYAYACNDRFGHRPVRQVQLQDGSLTWSIYTPQPGHMAQQAGLGGRAGPTGVDVARDIVTDWVDEEHAAGRPGLTASGVRFDVMMDDRVRRAKLSPFLLEPGQEPVNVPGYYLIALIVCGNDYHWLRQDSNGYWSHKPGITNAKDTDDDGNRIWDPRRATYRTHPYVFECFYQAPAGGVKTWRLGDQYLQAFSREYTIIPR